MFSFHLELLQADRSIWFFLFLSIHFRMGIPSSFPDATGKTEWIEIMAVLATKLGLQVEKNNLRKTEKSESLKLL